MALLTSTEAKALKPDLGGATQDTLIDTLIGRADTLLAQKCGYPRYDTSAVESFTAQTYTMYLDGPTWTDQRVLALPVFPISSITTIHDDPDRGYGAAYLVDSGDYETDDAKGLVILTDTSTQGYWSSSFRAQKVVASLGWSTVPGLIKHAGAELVWHWYRLQRGDRGKRNVSVAGQSLALWDAEVPGYILEMIADYRLPRVLL